ncbi:hypothetical protein [Paenibacillus lactis]|uniref:hypothetical protein n=1 Tax=Paenibacillus lactis TaxID=228574 RepID=UPI0036853F15
MKNLALGSGIFIVVELILILLFAVDGWVMLIFAAGVMITLLALTLIQQMEIVKYHRKQRRSQNREKIRELNRNRSKEEHV